MESFYGPWNVRLNHVDPYFRQRFIISGSDQADGRYEVSSGGVVNLEVTGSAWFVSLETEPFPPIAGQAWLERTIQRATRFEPYAGADEHDGGDHTNVGANHDLLSWPVRMDLLRSDSRLQEQCWPNVGEGRLLRVVVEWKSTC